MSMSTKVKGFILPDDPMYKKHSAVLLACIAAGIKEMPKETAEYFDCHPGEVSDHLLEEKLECTIPAHEYSADMVDGYEIIVSEIPKGVHKIRFYNSY